MTPYDEMTPGDRAAYLDSYALEYPKEIIPDFLTSIKKFDKTDVEVIVGIAGTDDPVVYYRVPMADVYLAFTLLKPDFMELSKVSKKYHFYIALFFDGNIQGYIILDPLYTVAFVSNMTVRALWSRLRPQVDILYPSF